MRRFGRTMTLLVALVATLSLAAPTLSGADFDDPLFVFTPKPEPPKPPEPPPWGYFEGPCGLEVDSAGQIYVADYYHDAVEIFTSEREYVVKFDGVDPLDGPCGMAIDLGGQIYVNDYHRAVVRYAASPSPPDKLTTFYPPVTIDTDSPTGVAIDPNTHRVYVDNRDHVSVYNFLGVPIEVSGEPLRVGVGSLGDGYGLAVSGYPATAGRVYVPDAATDTVKVYDPAVDVEDTVAVIDGSDVPGGGFVSLKDAAIAIDDASGKIYVADNRQPAFFEEPEAAIYVFGPDGSYLGRLKHNIVDALPPGLAVDNSAGPTQGRVYVTSGNSEISSVYAYPPGAETDKVIPATKRLSLAPPGAQPPEPPAPLTARAQGSASAEEEEDPLANTSEVSQRDGVRLTLGGKLSPRRLPRRGQAAIEVAVDWQLSAVEGREVPALKGVRIEINRHGRFDYSGLPICPVSQIQPASSARALEGCANALVGEGSFTADVALAGQEPYPAKGRLLVFNGIRGGKPVLLGHIFSPRPFATSFVITFAVKRLGSGTYGTALDATLPESLASWGNLTAVEMRLSRRYRHQGKQRSYISSGCPLPPGVREASFPLARASFSFDGGLKLSETLVRSCRAR